MIFSDICPRLFVSNSSRTEAKSTRRPGRSFLCVFCALGVLQDYFLPKYGDGMIQIIIETGHFDFGVLWRLILAPQAPALLGNTGRLHHWLSDIFHTASIICCKNSCFCSHIGLKRCQQKVKADGECSAQIWMFPVHGSGWFQSVPSASVECEQKLGANI